MTRSMLQREEQGESAGQNEDAEEELASFLARIDASLDS